MKYACYCKYSWPKPEAKRDQSCGDAYSSLLSVNPTNYCHKSVCLWMAAGATNTRVIVLAASI